MAVSISSHVWIVLFVINNVSLLNSIQSRIVVSSYSHKLLSFNNPPPPPSNLGITETSTISEHLFNRVPVKMRTTLHRYAPAIGEVVRHNLSESYHPTNCLQKSSTGKRKVALKPNVGLLQRGSYCHPHSLHDAP